ncbi:MAG: 16S rRNA (guanine(527)-N(7))-methyltransferase RsmG [Thermoleophilaceae bacterium]
MTVSRETQGRPVSRETLARFALTADQLAACERLLAALAAEPDPPTTVREPDQAAAVHVADSLAALELEAFSRVRRIADLGAGAGFPGLALAIGLPDAKIDLLEAARRKCAVIERLAAAARLGNTRALPVRAEAWAAGDGRATYDVVTARAIGPLSLLVEYAAPLLTRGGVLVAWKGARDSAEETAAAGAAGQIGMRLLKVVETTPYAGSRNRNLHVYLKVTDTPSRFPRRPGMALKRPLGAS